MNSLLSSLSSGLSTWTTIAAAFFGSVAIPGCPQAQTPGAETPTLDPNTTTTTLAENALTLTSENRPVTIPTPEDEAVLLP